MNGKIQESGLPEITPFLCVRLSGASILCFSHPVFLRARSRERLLPSVCLTTASPSWVHLGLRNTHLGVESWVAVTPLFPDTQGTLHFSHSTASKWRREAYVLEAPSPQQRETFYNKRSKC